MRSFLIKTIILSLLNFPLYGQEILNSLGSRSDQKNNLIQEKIIKISADKRIFILSNNNSFNEGDYISLLLQGTIIARALVIKIKNNRAGLKIIRKKDEIWKDLNAQTKVGIIRGDDSYYKNSKKEKDLVKGISNISIQSEDDLFDPKIILTDDINIEKTRNRIIKTDNFMGAMISRVEGLDTQGSVKTYNQITGSWSYQFEQNMWVEFAYGQNIINDYPNNGLDTRLSNIVAKAKYTIAAPLYLYIMPYIGYLVTDAYSPGAGVPPVNQNDQSTLDLEQEIRKVENLKTRGVVFGLTIYKRLVPGWFARLDIGSDSFAGGFFLEF